MDLAAVLAQLIEERDEVAIRLSALEASIVCIKALGKGGPDAWPVFIKTLEGALQ